MIARKDRGQVRQLCDLPWTSPLRTLKVGLSCGMRVRENSRVPFSRRPSSLHDGPKDRMFQGTLRGSSLSLSVLDHQEKTTGLSSEEKSELDNYMQLEHLMRLAKARARHHVANE